MSTLFSEETIYSFPDALEIDKGLNNEHLDKPLVICRKSDLQNGGKEKLFEILGAINWDINSNAQLLELENEQSLLLASGLPLKNAKRIVLTFGLKPMDLCIQSPFQYYEAIHFENAILISSNSMQELMTNKQFKGSLWNAIKHLKS